MTLLTVLEIVTNYPNGDIEIITAQHKETNKWVSLLYHMREGRIHKLILSFDVNETFTGWDTEEEAKQKMQEVVDSALDYYEKKCKL